MLYINYQHEYIANLEFQIKEKQFKGLILNM